LSERPVSTLTDGGGPSNTLDDGEPPGDSDPVPLRQSANAAHPPPASCKGYSGAKLAGDFRGFVCARDRIKPLADMNTIVRLGSKFSHFESVKRMNQPTAMRRTINAAAEIITPHRIDSARGERSGLAGL
jgi:hypothetical protein